VVVEKWHGDDRAFSGGREGGRLLERAVLADAFGDFGYVGVILFVLAEFVHPQRKGHHRQQHPRHRLGVQLKLLFGDLPQTVPLL